MAANRTASLVFIDEIDPESLLLKHILIVSFQVHCGGCTDIAVHDFPLYIKG